MKIAILYPRISHYREEFFEKLLKKHQMDFYLYESKEESEKNSFKNSYIKAKYPKTYTFFNNRVRYVDIVPILKSDYDVLILIGEMRSISVWILLLLSKFGKTKTILWGHGLSLYTYLEESENLKFIRKLFHKLADHNWFYTHKEVEIWEKHIDKSKLTALNNTINIEEILENREIKDKQKLKKRYNINTEINFIFSARFANIERRAELIPELIKKLDKNRYGFIIIGDGHLKPDFSSFDNVYDFGAIYDRDKKNELFEMADLYYQPAWTGLSVNEALAYGKMVLTFERSSKIIQSVEYAYLNSDNSYIAKDIDDLVSFIHTLDNQKIKKYSNSAKKYAKKNLTMQTMVDNALNSLDILESSR